MIKKSIVIFAASLLTMSSFSLKASTNTSIQADCVEVSLDIMEVHESYFGCMDADIAVNFYNFLFSACEAANSAL